MDLNKFSTIFGVLLLSACTTQPRVSPIELTACINEVNVKDDLGILFRIRNNNLSPIEIYKSGLPWGLSNSTDILVFLDKKGFEKIDDRPYPDDPSPDTIKIGFNEVQSGKVSLINRFPNLKGEIFKTPIAIYAKYELKNVDGDILASIREVFSINERGEVTTGGCNS